ncbi:MAG: hypothetical protein DRN27_07775 [Thermoplasmata archaeon]|nr:MAG: hypothetical protein DRN27_07775 [Thermoplasmata archaeon]
MLDFLNKRGIGFCTIIMLISISFFIVQSCTAESNENIGGRFDNFKKIQLTGEFYDFFEQHYIYESNHIGPFWYPCPSSVLTIRFNDDIELIVDGVVQDLEPPMTIFVYRFLGFCKTPQFYKGIEDKTISLTGYCEEYLYSHTIQENIITDTRLFNISDIVELGQTAWGLTQDDFNGDDLMDFAVSSATSPWTKSTISIFYGDGEASFTRDDVYMYDVDRRYIDDLDSGDFDGDGDIDLMFTYSESIDIDGLSWKTNGTVNLLFNDGEGNFVDETMIARHCSTARVGYGRYNPHVSSADYDNDSDLDFVVGDNSGIVEFYMNDGSGVFSSDGILYDYGQLSWGLTSGDFDNDGDIDLIIAAEYEKGQGHFYLKKNFLVESGGYTCFDMGQPGDIFVNMSAALGTCNLYSMDYNGDGLLDFVAGTTSVNVFINHGDYFDNFLIGELPGKDNHVDHLYYGDMTSFDVDLDGKEDLITGGVQGVVRSCINNFSQLPPLKPFIYGPNYCTNGIDYEYEYLIYTKDINGDDVYFYVDWNDGTECEWIGPYESGEEVILKKTWNEYGTHMITVVAKDSNGQVSHIKEFSLIIRTIINIDRDNALHSLFGKLFNQLTYPLFYRNNQIVEIDESVELEDSFLIDNIVSMNASNVDNVCFDSNVYLLNIVES